MDNRKLISAKDALIIVLLAGLAATFGAVRNAGRSENSGCAAVITADKSVVDRIPLEKSGSYEYPELPGVVFTVDSGSIRISENDCGDLTCVRTGAASRKGEAIICMPKKIAVEIADAANENGLDAVLR